MPSMSLRCIMHAKMFTQTHCEDCSQWAFAALHSHPQELFSKMRVGMVICHTFYGTSSLKKIKILQSQKCNLTNMYAFSKHKLMHGENVTLCNILVGGNDIVCKCTVVAVRIHTHTRTHPSTVYSGQRGIGKNITWH